MQCFIKQIKQKVNYIYIHLLFSFIFCLHFSAQQHSQSPWFLFTSLSVFFLSRLYIFYSSPFGSYGFCFPSGSCCLLSSPVQSHPHPTPQSFSLPSLLCTPLFCFSDFLSMAGCGPELSPAPRSQRVEEFKALCTVSTVGVERVFSGGTLDQGSPVL